MTRVARASRTGCTNDGTHTMSTEEEMEAGRKRNEYFANLGRREPTVPPNKPSGGKMIETAATAEPAPGKRQAPSAKQSGLSTGQENAGGAVGHKTTDDEIAQFMARVVPWPESSDAPGYINLHYTFWNGGEPPIKAPWAGVPTRTVEEFMKALKRVREQKSTRDIYLCLSLQSQTRLNKRGRVVAARSTLNALALKAIWLDIDVKEPPKGYATIDDATNALNDFCKAMDLPPPNALVFSGGGLHVYWINDTPLSPEEWKRYAEGLKAAAIKFGLKCDAGCTTDAARVLRVPGTFNYKKQPRRPVSLERNDD